jgi:cytochrome bd ubiquinol oxidase subunit I
MVGCGLLMMAVAWLGCFFRLSLGLDQHRILLWSTFLSFPLPFIATLTGWFTAEVGRQPWTVYGLMRTADAVSPNLTVGATTASLAFFCTIYVLIFTFGTVCIYRLIKGGPARAPVRTTDNPKRPMAIAGGRPITQGNTAEILE